MRTIKEAVVLLSLLLILIQVIQLGIVFSLTGAASTGTVGLCYNHAPTFLNLSNHTVAHNFEYVRTITFNDTNGDAVAIFDNTSLFSIINTTGVINFTPTISQVANYSILVTLRDYNSSCPLEASEVFVLSINNSIPQLSTIIPNQTWEEDVSLSGLDLDNYFTDYETDSVIYTVRYGSNVRVSIASPSNLVTIRPDRDFSGTSWMLFTANDTLGSVTSNNVSLNITAVANYCGDSACNADESCTSCSTDCGTCPASSSSSSGGGGGGTRIIEKIINNTGGCADSYQCYEWSPQSCDVGNQERRCIWVEKSCTVTKTIETRPCKCIPNIVCSVWDPEVCSPDQTQIRTCNDIHNCGAPVRLSTQKECLFDALNQSSGIFSNANSPLPGIVGAAYANLIPRLWSEYKSQGSYLVLVLLLCAVIVWWFYHKRYCLTIERIPLPIEEYTLEIETIVQTASLHRLRIRTQFRCSLNSTKGKYRKVIR